MTDMQNVHYLGCDDQGTENISTPNLDRIGKEGMIFQKATMPTRYARTTRASLLTGCYPFRHRQLHIYRHAQNVARDHRLANPS